LRKTLIFMFMLITLIACRNENSFTGQVHEVSEDYIVVDCSDKATGSQQPQTSIGYSCTVKITKDTEISGGDFEDLSKESRVTVVLQDDVEIDADDPESMRVTANEVIIR